MITRRTLLALAALAMPLAFSACESTPTARTQPSMSFAHLPPFKLTVSEVSVVSLYKSPLAAPNIEHMMNISPEAAARIWAKDRLIAAGGPFTAEFRILDAPVVEAELKTDKGFSGMFKKEQSARYNGALQVELRIRDQRGVTVASSEAKSTRSQTTPEDVTLNQRDQVWYEISESLIKEIDARLTENIRTYMPDYIK